MADISIAFINEQINKNTDLFFLPDEFTQFDWNVSRDEKIRLCP